jgi:hypothetical protein
MEIDPAIPQILLRFSLSEKLWSNHVKTPKIETNARRAYHSDGIPDIVYANLTIAVNFALLAKLHIQPFFDYIPLLDADILPLLPRLDGLAVEQQE